MSGSTPLTGEMLIPHYSNNDELPKEQFSDGIVCPRLVYDAPSNSTLNSARVSLSRIFTPRQSTKMFLLGLLIIGTGIACLLLGPILSFLFIAIGIGVLVAAKKERIQENNKNQFFIKSHSPSTEDHNLPEGVSLPVATTTKPIKTTILDNENDLLTSDETIENC